MAPSHMSLPMNVMRFLLMVAVSMWCHWGTAQFLTTDDGILASSNLPIILVDTEGQAIPDEPRIPARMQIIDNPDGARNFLSDEGLAYDGHIEIEIRGSSSQVFDKKQYRLETQLPNGENHNVSLLGMPAENDWILHAPTLDKTFIRNSLSYHIARTLGEYAPRTRACELVLNGEYRGVYVLMEKIKRDNNRLDIEEEGGYILKIDKPTGYECDEFLRTDLEAVKLQYDHPDCEEITFSQQAFIDAYVNEFEAALYAENYSDSEEGYRNYLDVESFVNYFICSELSKNVDAYRFSTFLHKPDESSKLNFGPIWDMNLGYGNSRFFEGHRTDGFIGTRTEADFGYYLNPWIPRLLSDTSLVSEIHERWVSLRSDTLSDESLLRMVDSLAGQWSEAQTRNFQRWPGHLSRLWSNFFVGSSYEEEVDFLKGWMINRAHWLDNHMTGTYVSASSQKDIEATLFPNPFRYFFTYAFRLDETGSVSLKIVSPLGSEPLYIVKDRPFGAGQHTLTWNSFVNGRLIPSQHYVVVLELDGVPVRGDVVMKHM